MALTLAEQLQRVGMPGEQAKLLQEAIEGITPSAPTAAQVSFDPSSAPGVTATDVQGALEELATLVDT